MKNAFLIHTLENDSDAPCYLEGDSVAVQERNTGYWLFSLAQQGDFTDLCGALGERLGTFYVNGSEFRDELEKTINNAKLVDYVQFNLESNDFSADPRQINSEVSVVPLDSTWVDFILSLYDSSEFGTTEYISSCIENHAGFGALIDGERVGYVTIHMTGEIGSMVISERCRGKGVGRTLMQYITPEYAKEGSIGCGFVRPENVTSQKMMVNSCFTPLSENIMWVYH